MLTVNASTSHEIDAAFVAFAREQSDALFVGPDVFFNNRRVQLANLAARYGIPASFAVRDYAEAGGLMSYGTDVADMYRQVGVYTGRILKGAKPAELPVVQSVKIELANAIPIIGVMADPVAYGVVANLARPGGNVTGASVDARLETWAKRIQVMQEVIPTAAKVGYLNLRSSWDLAQGRYSMNRRRDCLNKPNGVSRGSLLGSHRTLISHAVRRISKRRGSASIG
jgi:ABC-type uncharacterized transport system substrate-binding protein